METAGKWMHELGFDMVVKKKGTFVTVDWFQPFIHAPDYVGAVY